MASHDYRLSAIMVTDIAGYRHMLEEDEGGARQAMDHYAGLVSDLARRYGGEIIKYVGDSFLVSFGSSQGALLCAVELQKQCDAYNTTASSPPLLVRVGIHVGEVHFFEGDAVGEPVTAASELQSLARPAGICVSEEVHNLAGSAVSEGFTRLGTVRLGANDLELAVYELLPIGEQVAAAHDTEVARKRLYTEEELGHRELRNMVFAEIKRAGRRLSIDEIRSRFPERSARLERVLAELSEQGFLTRLRREDGSPAYASASYKVPVRVPDRRGVGDDKSDKQAEKQWDQVLETSYEDPESEELIVSEYVEQTAEAADKARSGFVGHLASYAGVNGFLFFIWASTGAGFPWFLFPLLGWGIGITTHFANVVHRQREKKMLQSAERPTREQLRIFRKLMKARSSFSSHLVSNVATSVLLFAINMITSPGFLWSVFPIGGMGIGLLSHYPAFKSKEKRLRERLAGLGFTLAPGGRSSAVLTRGGKGAEKGRRALGGAAAGSGGTRRIRRGTDQRYAGERGDVADQAERIRERILEQLAGFGKGQAPFGEEIRPVLNDYVARIRELGQKDSEIAQIVDSIPISALESDLKELAEKRRRSQDSRVIREYDHSIEQILKQKRSFEELQNEQEILRLRLGSALNALKQMQIDLARMKSLTTRDELESLALIKEKSRELSLYLDDLREGYEELERG